MTVGQPNSRVHPASFKFVRVSSSSQETCTPGGEFDSDPRLVFYEGCIIFYEVCLIFYEVGCLLFYEECRSPPLLGCRQFNLNPAALYFKKVDALYFSSPPPCLPGDPCGDRWNVLPWLRTGRIRAARTGSQAWPWWHVDAARGLLLPTGKLHCCAPWRPGPNRFIRKAQEFPMLAFDRRKETVREKGETLLQKNV